MLPSSSLTVPDVQLSRFRFFMEEFRSRGCNDGRFGLPAGVAIEHIRTLAGGYVGFRFVCEAMLTGIDPQLLPPGSTVPGSVRYISQLTGKPRRHEVTLSVEPRIRWVRVQ